MSTCACGTTLADNAEWCPVCLKKPVDRDKLLDEMHETFRKTTWSPPERLTKQRADPVYSRWRAGPRSFGPRVKVAITVVSVGTTVAGATVFGVLFVAPLIIVTTLLMYSTWTRERIR
jgi:hypothetical protein